jgi:DNA-binding transcriptional regulator YhcF (GntR family)
MASPVPERHLISGRGLPIIFAMKIWIAKNSEVPVREQLIAQITLGIAAGDFAIGERLPSTREIARRCGIHANTVGASYQRLVEQNLLEFKQGSGFYVAESAGERIEGVRRLDELIEEVLATADALGFDDAHVIGRLRRRRIAKPPDRIVVVESDTGLRDILVRELSSQFRGAMGVTFEEFSSGKVPPAIVTAMFDEKAKLDSVLKDGQTCVYLKGRSVSAAMAAEARPGPDEIVSVVSGWEGFLNFARIMLHAANIPPGNIVVRSTRDPNWSHAVRSASIIICDSLTADSLDGRDGVRTFRIISDESITELANATDTT